MNGASVDAIKQLLSNEKRDIKEIQESTCPETVDVD